MGTLNQSIKKREEILDRSEFGYTAYANFIPFEMQVDGVITCTLVMARKDVDALGWPEKITVTIEPGNKLTSRTPKQQIQSEIQG